MDWEKAMARFFSVVLHPLLMPTLGMLVLFRLNPYIGFSVSNPARAYVFGIVFINTCLAPAVAIMLLKRRGLIEDALLGERSERLLPLLVSSLLFFLTYYLLKQLTLPSLIYYYVMGATLMVLLTLIITFRYKISIHMVSMGGFTGFLIASSLLLRSDVAWLILLSLLLSGVLGSSRLKLQAHTPGQVYSGFLLGVSVMLILYAYLRV